MSEQNRRCKRHRRAKATKKGPTPGPNNRSVYLYGLRSCRVLRALGQRELAQKIGTHQSTICDLEHRNRGAYPKTIRRLCEVLEVEPADLIREDF